MKFLRKKIFLRSLALTITISLVTQVFLPTVSYALTSGPAQPEFSSFEPVATTGMVNEFTGDFTYNIPVLNVPGPNGGGYAMSLSYHSGVNMEEDASWVGYGWTLNPGAINRNKKGIPDDYNGNITKQQKMDENFTMGVGPTLSVDFFTFFAPSVGRSIRYNNYKGYSVTREVGISFMDGLVSVGYSFGSDGSRNFDVAVNPMALAGKGKKKKAEQQSKFSCEKESYAIAKSNNKKSNTKGTKEALKQAKSDLVNAYRTDANSSKGLGRQVMKSAVGGALASKGSHYIKQLYSSEVMPLTISQYTGYTFSGNLNFGFTPSLLEIAGRVGLWGYYNYQQFDNNEERIPAHGYIHSATAGGMMDYAMEKENVFNKRDFYLPIPFSCPDQFAVTGEGLGGSFRFHSAKPILFTPESRTNQTYMFNFDAQAQVGYNFGAGSSTAVGLQFSQTNTGNLRTVNNSKVNISDYYLKFDGDKALDRSKGFASGDVPVSASHDTEVYSNLGNVKDKGAIGRSSYIGYNLNSVINSSPKLAYERSNPVEGATVTRSGTDYENLVGEIATYNEDGNRYVYGLPVYCKNDLTISKGVQFRSKFNTKVVSNPYNGQEITRDGVINKTEITEPYAFNYLLTQITTPDYIDRTFNGPSEDDFGGWTKFNYAQKYNIGNNTYEWRMPYGNNWNVDRGSLSDPRDDVANYSSGNKEVYYLSSVETKTHIAKFNTSDRLDGKSNNGKKLQKLDNISLYAKDLADPDDRTKDKLLKIVRFEYAENGALCGSTPNSSASGGSKLTLKKVWFEYEGTVNSRIAPYEFDYQYKRLPKSTGDENTNPLLLFKDDTDGLKGKFPTSDQSILNYSKRGPSTFLNENPNYDANATNAWGNWASQGAARNELMKPWVDQGNTSNTDYDPAAWNLKTITLPSGAQILVQYEEHTYSHVQDKQACVMAPISSYAISGTSIVNGSPIVSIEIDANQLSFTGSDKTGTQAAQEIASLINSQFSGTNERLYFKFLYALQGSGSDLNSCGVEYIDGYSQVGGIATASGSTVQFNLSSTKTPRDICQDFYAANRMMVVQDDCSDSPSLGDPLNAVQELLNKYFNNFEDSKKASCGSLILNHSYIRVPVKKKKGGGIRVKRIMMYDPGFTNQEETLYGTEYIYEDQNGVSWGVALNEPAANRGENPLVSYMPNRSPQSLAEVILSGEQKDQMEGPIGETLLPSASVSYSRVVANPILPNDYTDKSAGFKVTEYYTVFDFPTVQSNTTTWMDKHEKDRVFIPVILAMIDVLNYDLAQGYAFSTNDMHGKLKRSATYSGFYDVIKGVNWDVTTVNPPANGDVINYIASQEIYEYTKPGEAVPVLKETGDIENATLGREEDMVSESHGVEDYVFNSGFNFNISVGFPPLPVVPIFQFYMYPTVAYSEHIVNSNETTRIIHYPAVLKKITSTKDGATFIKENKVFDPITGEPLVTTVTDEFAGSKFKNQSDVEVAMNIGKTIQYDIPAWYVYPALGPKYQREQGLKKSGLSLNVNTCTSFCGDADIFVSISGSDDFNGFESGDIVYLKNGTNLDIAAAVVSKSGNSQLNLDVLSGTPLNIPYTNVEVYLVESAYSNRLKLVAGSMTAYGADVQTSNGKIVSPFINTSGNIQLNSAITNLTGASSIIYSDQWYMDNFLLGKYGISKDVSAPITYSPYLNGERGKWRMKESYVFKGVTNVSNGQPNGKNFNSGIIQDFETFNYLIPSANNNKKWLRSALTTRYSPNGDALEEQNILGVYSTAQFGYKDNVPVLVAANASFPQVGFAGYEDNVSSEFTSSGGQLVTDKTQAHSGTTYLSIASNLTTKALPSFIQLPAQSDARGVKARMWVKAQDKGEPSVGVQLKDKATHAKIANGNVNILARTGDWCLLEADFEATVLTLFADLQEVELYVQNLDQQTVFIDDVRIQPAEAQMSCYVYDKTNLKLLASFDDQHFGLFYQYDLEGKLVRKLVETEKGIKTVSETHYNTPLRTRTFEP